MSHFTEPNAYQTLKNASEHIRWQGYAAPNRFEILITPPRLMMSNMASNARVVSMACETINLPGRNLNSTPDTLIYGPTREVVDGITYAEDITITFNASSGLEERIFFEKWQELAFDRKTWNLGYYNEYISEIDIYLINRKNKKRYGIKLIEAFPKTISPTQLSQAANNEIIKTTVSFAFRYWETLDIERQPIKLRVGNKANSVERQRASATPAVLIKLGDPYNQGGQGGSYRQLQRTVAKREAIEY